MPNPSEICTIVADGQRYDIWEQVEIHRAVPGLSGGVCHGIMTVSEISTGGANFAALKLTVGDQVSMQLAGITIISGFVYMRQAAYDDKVHAVQIGVSSRTQAVVRTTVDVNPGTYPNQTIEQIGKACFGAVGIGFSVIGSPDGANLKFKRACEQLGESRFNFIERLTRLVNLHLLDDGFGNFMAFRGPIGESGALLQEGVNIKRGRLLLQIDDHVPELQGIGQSSNPQSGPQGAQVSADTTVPSPGNEVGGKVKFGVEDEATQDFVQHRVNHQGDYDAMKTVDGTITVQGWFAPDGDLWWNKVGKTVKVNSPMLIPEDSIGLVIKEVIHRQSSAEGTTTDILVTNPRGIGGPPLVNATP
jgi:prophage tail gpP-like protein